jgi:Rrf2 family protein
MAGLSAKTEYACVAVIDLASQFAKGEPVRLKAIVERHGIPSRFLVQIMLQLKTSGLVNSVRGASGGYQLNRPPSEITLGDVIRIMDGGEIESATNLSVANGTSDALLNVWQRSLRAQTKILDSVSIADLVAEAKTTDGDMYYI